MKRKATKAAPPDFPDIKLGFLQRIKDEVVTNSIPLALVLNLDQTSSKLVPVSEWTMEKQVVGKWLSKKRGREGNHSAPHCGGNWKTPSTYCRSFIRARHLVAMQR